MQNIEKVYKEYSNTVFKYLFCLTGKEELAEDLTQETFAIAIKEIGKFRGDCKISVWLCQIAKHLWYKELKKRKKNTNVSINDLNEELTTDESIEEIICDKEDKLKLFKSMQKLDEKSKEVMYLNLIGNLIQNFLIPSVLIVTTLSIISQIGDKVQINKLAKFFNSGIVWLLGVILTIFVGIISLEGTLSSSVDGITAKTTKAIVSSSIPIVGKILGDAVDSVLGCGIILKNAIGVIGVIIIIGICIMPIIKIAILTISYKVLAGICEPIADEKIIKLLDQIGNIFKVLLAILCSMSVMVIIGTTLVIKISNSGMMYR